MTLFCWRQRFWVDSSTSWAFSALPISTTSQRNKERRNQQIKKKRVSEQRPRKEVAEGGKCSATCGSCMLIHPNIVILTFLKHLWVAKAAPRWIHERGKSWDVGYWEVKLLCDAPRLSLELSPPGLAQWCRGEQGKVLPISLGIPERQPYPGQHQKKHEQQGEGGDSALCSHENRGAVHPECCIQLWSLQ